MTDFITGSSVDPLAAAFIAETPADEPGDEERKVRVLKSLVESA